MRRSGYRAVGRQPWRQLETINGLYKTEVIHRRGPWKSVEAVELATLPAEAEANYYRNLSEQAVAA